MLTRLEGSSVRNNPTYSGVRDITSYSPDHPVRRNTPNPRLRSVSSYQPFLPSSIRWGNDVPPGDSGIPAEPATIVAWLKTEQPRVVGFNQATNVAGSGGDSSLVDPIEQRRFNGDCHKRAELLRA